MSPSQFDAFVCKEIATNAEIVKAAGLKRRLVAAKQA
jgi:tripartite-type tricarboxylate transporter receptor subunit TctC